MTSARALFAAVALLVALAVPTAAGAADPPGTSAASWVVIDARDGELLGGLDEEESRAMASTTKVMTARVVLEDLDIGRTLTVPRYDALAAESVLGLGRGERVLVEDLLYALLMASANDAADALARRTSGSLDAFVVRMNEEAGELGLEQTSFSNPVGLDEPDHFSSALDLAHLARVLRRDRLFRRIVDTESYTLQSGAFSRTIANRNTLLGRAGWINGVKTGFTADAGNVLVASGDRKGVELIAVVMGEPSEAARDDDALALLRWGLSRYERERPLRRESALTQAAIRYEDSERLGLVPAEGFATRVRDDQELEISIDAPEMVEGPIEAGTRLGRATVTLDGRRLASVPLLAAGPVEAPGFFDRHGAAVRNFLLLSTLLLLVVWLARYRDRRRRRDRREQSRRLREQAEKQSSFKSR